MLSFFLAMLLVMSIPAVCWSFVAHGQHKLAGKTRVGKHEGRRSRTSTTTRAHPAAGFVAARGNSRTAAATRRSAKPSRRACRATPRTVPPLHTSGHRGSEAVAPLRVFSPDTVYSANEVIAGVAGGSVGVLGTLIQLELKQERLKSRRNCPYCNGSGKLACATCYSAGTFTTKLPGAETFSTLPCPGCSGTRYINCLNCRGDGRAVPRELDKKTDTAAEVDLRLEEIGMGGIGQ